MQDDIKSIITGIIANMFTQLILGVAKKSGEMLVGKELREKWVREKAALSPIIMEAITTVSDTFAWSGNAPVEEVCLFLTSPETESIIRQIYSRGLSGRHNTSNIGPIKEEFKKLFELYIDSAEDKEAGHVDALFQVLFDGCESAISRAIDKGILSAHEAKSNLRYQQIRDEISNVQRNLSFLMSCHKPDVRAILDFEKQYREQVSSRHSFLIPPTLMWRARYLLTNSTLTLVFNED